MRKKDKFIFVLSGFGIAILLSLIISLAFVLTGVMKFDHKLPDWVWDMEDLLGSVKENLPNWDMDNLPEDVQQDLLDWLGNNLNNEDVDKGNFQNILESSTIVYTNNATKPWDGEPLTCDEWYVLNDAKIKENGHRLEVKPNGSQTDIGTSSNFAYIAVFDEYGNEVTYDYVIIPIYGKLIVTDGNEPDVKPEGQSISDIIAGGLSSLASGELLKNPLSAGAAMLSQIEVLRVRADTDGYVYLRHRSFGDYNGKEFSSEPVPFSRNGVTGVFNSTSDCLAMGTNRIAVSVIAEGLESYFLPYYATTEYSLKDDIMLYDYQKEYSVDFKKYDYLTSDAALASKNGLTEYNDFVHNNYLALDGGLKSELLSLTGFSASGRDLICEIANYVRNAAMYNMEFEPFPDDADMVLYFLTESKQGICQHFAAAATAIYRAYGIPARYTVGFLAEVSTDKLVKVTSREAHAWVEIYLDDIGWIQIEVTGGGFSPTGGTEGGINVPDENEGADDNGGTKISDEPFEESDAQVASIVADKSGLYYLRMTSYGDYTGREFAGAPVYAYSFGGIDSVFNPTVLAIDGNTGNMHVTVLDNGIANMLLTYYATDVYHLDSDAAVKTALKEYDVPFKVYDYTNGGAFNKNNLAAYNVFVRNTYLNITPELQAELLALTGLDKNSPTLISDIANYVRNCATYDKDFHIPQDVDVVTYFLTEGQKGICQHFAAAGTMIYRAYGIPARYTVGYVVAAQKDEETAVLAKDAHAWVEIYLDDVGWIQIEVTADDGLPEYRRTIKVINDGEEQPYDGTPLSVNTDDLTVLGQLWEGHSLEYDSDNLPSITNVKDNGSTYNAPNFRITDEDGNDVTDDYIWDYSECGTLTITPCQIFLTLSGEKIYDGTKAVPKDTVYIAVEREDGGDSLYGDDELAISFSDLNSDNVGNYGIGISSIGITNNGEDVSANYDVHVAPESEYTINQKDITVTTESKSWVYDGSYHYWNHFSVSGIIDADQAEAVAPYTYIKDTGTLDNEFGINIYRNGSSTSKYDNYNIISFEYGTLEVSNTIYVSSDNKRYEYDGKEYSGSTYSAVGKNGAELPTGFSIDYTPATLKNAGSVDNKPVSVTIRNKNGVDVTSQYVIDYSGCESKQLTVYKRDITVKTKDLSKPYDGTALTNGGAELYLGGSGLADGHYVAPPNYNGSQTEIGHSLNSIDGGINGIIIYDESSNVVTDNYNITFTAGSLTVTKRTLTVTSGSNEKVYDGTPLTMDDYTFDGFLSGDNVASYTPASITNAGTVENRLSELVIKDGGGNDVTERYVIEYSSCGTLTVNKRTLYVSSNNGTKAYDGDPLVGSGYEFNNLASGDGAITDELQAASITDVGSVQNKPQNVIIRCGGENVTGNYTFNYDNCGTLTVTGTVVNVTSGNYKKTYDGTSLTADVNDYHFIGLIGEDYASYTPASITDAGTASNKPTDIIIIDKDGNDVTGRYEFNYSGCGTLKVTPCEIEIRLSGSKTYDGETFVYGALLTYKVYIGGELAELYNNQTAEIYADMDNAFVGNRIIDNAYVTIYEGTRDVTTNYNITFNGTVAVNKRDIIVYTDNENVIYNGTEQHGTAIYAENLVSGHEVTAAFNGYVNAGEHENSISALVIKDGVTDVTENYNVTAYHFGTFTIEKRAVTVTSNSAEKTFDGEPLVGGYELYNLVSGHYATYTAATITEPGTIANIPTDIMIFDANDNEVTVNYELDLSGCNGKTLKVNKIVITLTSGDVTEKYNGTPLDGNCVASANPLEDKGYVMNLTQRYVTDVGWAENRATVKVIKNGEDVTDKYYTVINGGCGKITVTPRSVTVTSANLNKYYDGTALTNGGEEPYVSGDGLASGQEIDKNLLKFTGSQTEVGDSPNFVENIVIKDANGNTVNSSNYKITIVYGTLTVNPPL